MIKCKVVYILKHFPIRTLSRSPCWSTSSYKFPCNRWDNSLVCTWDKSSTSLWRSCKYSTADFPDILTNLDVATPLGLNIIGRSGEVTSRRPLTCWLMSSHRLFSLEISSSTSEPAPFLLSSFVSSLTVSSFTCRRLSSSSNAYQNKHAPMCLKSFSNFFNISQLIILIADLDVVRLLYISLQWWRPNNCIIISCLKNGVLGKKFQTFPHEHYLTLIPFQTEF